MPVATEISKPDLDKIKRLQANLPREYREVPFIPLEKDETTFIEIVQKQAPYYILSYGGSLLRLIPKFGPILGTAVDWLAKRFGVQTRTLIK